MGGEENICKNLIDRRAKKKNCFFVSQGRVVFNVDGKKRGVPALAKQKFAHIQRNVQKYQQ